ncbi:unnamed protein product [Psylliodes chrysocephalus]|uniref:DUF8207 domain-containing protein n=1 Tax=Psylliodes chrysocephalus TaxID=3402493 RepID=A0A9P0GBS1_9CUCU|nr:unnamed protein product [Psylliodes chrysocephala]
MMSDDRVAIATRKRKIAELARGIRKKYLLFKLGRSEEDESINKLFKPLSDPLKEIVQSSKILNESVGRIKKEEPLFTPKKTPSTPSRIPQIIRKLKEKEETPFLSLEEIARDDGDGDDDDDDDNQRSREGQQEASFSEQVMDEYLEQYPVMSHPYIKAHWSYSPIIDDLYGPTYDPPSSKWFLGTKEIDFDKKTGYIKIEGKQVRGTPGLYQLIFYRDPDDYNDEDLAAYKGLLKLTDNYLKKDGNLKGTARNKWTHILKFIVERKMPPSGSGLTYNEKPIEYVYWDDPNELVDRLKLLIASKDAGNTSHDNEIVAIINELKEANIIR